MRTAAGARRGGVWLAAGLLAFPYLVFSVVVVLNSIGNATGAVWLPSFPSAYYQAKAALELPLQPYFALFEGLRNSTAVTYAQYTALSRGPIVVATLALVVAAAQALRRPTRKPASANAQPRLSAHSVARTRVLLTTHDVRDPCEPPQPNRSVRPL